MVKFLNGFVHRWEWLRVRNLHTWWACSRANPWSSTVEERHAKADSLRPAALASSTSDRALLVLPGLWRSAAPTCPLTIWNVLLSPSLTNPVRLSSGRGHCIQFKHQWYIRAENPEHCVCVAGRRGQWWGDGGSQTCGGLPGWKSQQCVRGQGARWVSNTLYLAQ